MTKGATRLAPAAPVMRVVDAGTLEVRSRAARRAAAESGRGGIRASASGGRACSSAQRSRSAVGLVTRSDTLRAGALVRSMTPSRSRRASTRCAARSATPASSARSRTVHSRSGCRRRAWAADARLASQPRGRCQPGPGFFAVLVPRDGRAGPGSSMWALWSPSMKPMPWSIEDLARSPVVVSAMSKHRLAGELLGVVDELPRPSPRSPAA